MIVDSFQVVGDSLTGHGLAFDLSSRGIFTKDADADTRRALVDVANVIYKQGRESTLLDYDDRFDMYEAIEALRALSVIVSPTTPTGDRYRRCADIIARLLQEGET